MCFSIGSSTFLKVSFKNEINELTVALGYIPVVTLFVLVKDLSALLWD